MHKYSLEPTIELKPPSQINFGKCSERKGCRKSPKIPKKSLQICKPMPAIHNLWRKEKQTPRKMFPLSVLK